MVRAKESVPYLFRIPGRILSIGLPHAYRVSQRRSYEVHQDESPVAVQAVKGFGYAAIQFLFPATAAVHEHTFNRRSELHSIMSHNGRWGFNALAMDAVGLIACTALGYVTARYLGSQSFPLDISFLSLSLPVSWLNSYLGGVNTVAALSGLVVAKSAVNAVENILFGIPESMAIMRARTVERMTDHDFHISARQWRSDATSPTKRSA